MMWTEEDRYLHQSRVRNLLKTLIEFEHCHQNESAVHNNRLSNKGHSNRVVLGMGDHGLLHYPCTVVLMNTFHSRVFDCQLHVAKCHSIFAVRAVTAPQRLWQRTSRTIQIVPIDITACNGDVFRVYKV